MVQQSGYDGKLISIAYLSGSSQAAEAMAPSLSAGATSKINAAFTKNASNTKAKTGTKAVSYFIVHCHWSGGLSQRR